MFEVYKNQPTKTKTPWKDGYWYNKNTATMYLYVNGEKTELRYMIDFEFPDMIPIFTKSWKYGDFGIAKPEVAEVSGIRNYNMEVQSMIGETIPAVLNEDGNKIYFYGFNGQVDVIEWLSDDDMKKFIENCESADAPSCPYYEPDPEKPRRIIWLSGTYLVVYKDILGYLDNACFKTQNYL